MISKRERDQIADITASLRVLDLEQLSLRPVMAAIQTLTELVHVGTYSLRNHDGRWTIARWDLTDHGGELERRAHAVFDAAPTFPVYYDPHTPPPAHRNKVVDAYAWVQAHAPGTWDTSAMYRDALQPLGIGHAAQPRALLCDGPALLGWFGAIHDGEYTQRHRRLLTQLVAPMRRRLMAERALLDGPVVQRAFDALLDRIGRAAYLIDAAGTIRHANAAGALLRAEDRALPAALREAARGDHTRFELTEVQARGEPVHWIAVLRVDTIEARIQACVATCAARWRLTPRQRTVLELVTRGLANATIASTLGCVERTIELHVTALFDRAGVDNRAALVARVLTSMP